jgi:hypothetical protein
MSVAGPHPDPVAEAIRVIAAADAEGLPLRLTGGVGIASISPSALRPPLARAYGDIDFVGRSNQVAHIEALFKSLGYEPERQFNDLHGETRLFFQDHAHSREADVFIDGITACHRLDLRDRLDLPGPTVPPSDLLLSKLQIVNTTQKDQHDMIALLLDHEVVADGSAGIGLDRITEICAGDWGWWRTVSTVAAATIDIARNLADEGQVDRVAHQRLTRVADAIESAPKSRKWKMRARVGDRVRWHEQPEALEHDAASEPNLCRP